MGGGLFISKEFTQKFFKIVTSPSAIKIIWFYVVKVFRMLNKKWLTDWRIDSQSSALRVVCDPKPILVGDKPPPRRGGRIFGFFQQMEFHFRF